MFLFGKIKSNTMLKVGVVFDLIINLLLIPLYLFLKLYIKNLFQRYDICLVEEHILGSIVDYVYASLRYNLGKVIRILLPILFRFTSLNRWTGIVYLECPRELLPQRWALRGTPPENVLYLYSQDLIFRLMLKVSKLYNDNMVLHIDTSRPIYVSAYKIYNFIISKLSKGAEQSCRSR